MTGRFRNSYAEINLQNLQHNFKLIRSKVNGAGLCPMVKADAYGHGDIHVARVLERQGARYLGVALIEEGIRLRQQGIQLPILVFGFFDAIGAEALVRYRLTPVLSQFNQIDQLKTALHDGAAFPIHAKFNTGMQRLGFELEEAQTFAQTLALDNFLKLEGICTHFVSQNLAEAQVKKFSQIEEIIKNSVPHQILTHVSNSAAIFQGLSKNFDIYRPGISLYGCSSSEELKPVMTLKSQVAHLHKVKKGDSVSYSATWTAPQDSLIAVIPLGYADGYPRHLSQKGEVLIQGMRAPVRGIVCMDYFMVDVTAIPQCRIGDEVIILGKQNQEQITADDLAQKAETISYEILTGIQSRVPRVYLHSV